MIDLNYKLWRKQRAIVAAILALFCVSLVGNTVLAVDEGFYSSNDILYYDPKAQVCAGDMSGAVSFNEDEFYANIPAPWNQLISSTAPKYTDVDPRLVAATLWVENRGWPEYKTSGWATSTASAQGPWQFIPQTWASMGTDGDGDGSKNPDNPKDAVHAAFKHQSGSAGKPIMEGYSNNPDSAYSTIPFKRDNKNLLSYLASYNGSGAPDGVTLANFPRKENADYVIMGFWLLATNFEKSKLPGESDFVDTKTYNNKASGSESMGSTSGSSDSCGGGASNGVGLEAVVNIAKQEHKKNVKEYDSNTLKYTTGRQEAWCADFVSWVFNEAGVPFTGGGAGGWQFPAVVTLQAWFKEGKDGSSYFEVGDKAPQPGDVAFYIGSQTPDGGSTQHTNIVISVSSDGKTMTTIGGNEGDALKLSDRRIELGAASLVGFGRK